MRTLYGSTSWRRVLALVLVFVMMVSTMGTSGYSVFAEDLVETNEEVTVSEPEATVPEVTEDIQGPSPGEEESEAVVDPATDAEPVEASEDGEEPAADSELVETSEEGEEPAEEVAEPVEETEEGEEPADAETVEETEEGEEPADAETVEETEEAEPVEPAEETLISEAAQVIAEDDGEAVAEPVEAVEELPEELIEEPVVIAMPAIDAEKLFDDARVTVSAPEGAFPDGTTVAIEEVTLGRTQSAAIENAVEAKVVSYKAYDITFNNGDQTDMQPAEGYAVKVNIEPYSMPEAENLQVVHMEDRKTATVVESETTEEGLAFDAEHFSVYVVVETGEDARLEVEFVLADGKTVSMLINKRQANDADMIKKYIYDPGVGTLPEGAFFDGWSDEENYTPETAKTASKTIDDIRTEVKAELNKTGGIQDGDKLTYYAMVFIPYTVTYTDELRIMIKSDQILVRADAEDKTATYTVNNPYTPYPTGEDGVDAQFMGWQQLKPETDTLVLYKNGEATLPLNADNPEYVLTAFTQKGYWLSFNENLSNATFTAPQFLPIGSTPSEPANPTRAGYTFDGWYTEDDSTERDGKVKGSEFSFTQPLTQSTTVHAKWSPATEADYSVVIWLQNLTADGYDYSGTTITVEDAPVGKDTYPITIQGTGNGRTVLIYTNENTYRGYTQTGFHPDHVDAAVKVAPEGNTVINLYFNRNEHTFTFRRDNRTIHTVTKLYGQDISDIWSFTGSDGRTYPQTNPPTSWQPSGSSTYTARITRMEVMPDENITFAHTTTNNQVRYFHYYVEALPNAENTRTYNGTQYSLYSELTHDFNLIVYNDDFWNLDGFTRYQIATANGANVTNNIRNAGSNGAAWQYDWNNNLYFYYSRNVYNIEYRDGIFVDGDDKPVSAINRGPIDEVTGVKYQLNINDDAYNKTPTLDGFVFLGWYDNDACAGEKYNFTTMPSHNVTLYAKWGVCEYEINLIANGSESDPVKYNNEKQATTFYVEEGEKIADVGGTRVNFDLVGWYTNANFTQAFSFDSIAVTKQTVESYGKLYTESEIDPLYPTTIGELNLYAKWRSKLVGAKGIQLEYEPGAGTISEDYLDNNYYVDKAMAIAIPAATPNDTSNYVFSHWEVQKWNGTAYVSSDVNVFPGDDFEVKVGDAKITDADGNVVTTVQSGQDYTYTIQLKAVYVEKDKEILTFINWYNNYDGGLVSKSEKIKINEATKIPAAPTRDGYVFLGWIRGIEEDGPTTTLTNLWLTYKDGKYYRDATNEAEFVAADENLVNALDPEDITSDGNNSHHALYAKWQAVLEVKITGNTASKTYSGSEQYVDGYKVEYKVADGDWTETKPDAVTVSYSGDAIASGTNVSQYPMNLAAANFTVNAGAYAFDKNENLTITDGGLTITPANISVSDTATEKFDGTEKTLTINADKAEGVIEGEALTLENATIKGTDIGTYSTVNPQYTWSVAKADGSDSTKNYTIEVSGTLTIEEAAEPPVETIIIEYHANYKDADDVVVDEESNLPATIKHPDNVKKDDVAFSTSGQWKNETTGKTWNFIGWYTLPDKDTEGGTWYKEPPVEYNPAANDDQNGQDDAGNATIIDQQPVNPSLAGTSSFATSAVLRTLAMAATSSEGDTADLILYAQWDEVVEPVEAKPHLTVTKTVDPEPAADKKFALDEEIVYKITVTNDGNVELGDIKVTDTLNVTVAEGESLEIKSLQPGESKTITVTYKVTQEDINRGSITNGATAEGKIPGSTEDIPVTPGEVTVPTNKPDDGGNTPGGGDNPRPRPNPDPAEEEETIDDGDTPLAPAEEEEPIDDGDTPLAPYEEETEIDDEATPLTPFTGDDRHTDVWAFLSILSLAGIVLLGRKRREEE